MATIPVNIPHEACDTLHVSQQELPREVRIAACVQWYAEGKVSQGKAAELAGLSRAEFLDELLRRKVPACQATLEELIEEIEHA